ncbi:hypothetical protein ATK17_2184 [Branchiibius hedensis]|uniref:PEP-CTERM protein-sorting domain-containing protein n=1 Tax=Branchiibius hedensis TaxID=672460 RepID=A0A2Y8ZSD0_9MICO|nr:hypothetical protein [Branchiibius hedensis]PWJ26042.1 hypothetical protein ATK17_2184 [Branchiibius hedensis]SSA34854.1 hypothetical protein SAMN04489750_2184 [Branchiibius hedensis]
MVIRVRFARSVALAVLAALAAGCFALVAAYVLNQRIPVLWGRYTASQTACSGTGRFTQCILTGDWVSNDGSRAVTNLTLDRRFVPSGTVAAGYRDGAVLDGEGLIVTQSGTQMTPAPWIVLAAGVGCSVAFYRTLRRD